MKKSRLKFRGSSDISLLKEQIQATLRAFVIKRDKGCVLRDYPEAGKCGGLDREGDLILQAEHLHTRANTSSFADTRNVVCLCKYHHIFWKPQHSDLYWDLMEYIVGPKRWEYLQELKKDRLSHKTDLKLALVALKQDLKKLK